MVLRVKDDRGHWKVQSEWKHSVLKAYAEGKGKKKEANVTPSHSSPSDSIRIKVAMKLLGVCRNTLLRWLKAGWLKGVREGSGRGVWAIDRDSAVSAARALKRPL